MGDCWIPVNIQVRKNDLKALNSKVEAVKKEFSDLKTAFKNADDKASSDDIQKLIFKIDQVLAEKEK
jgi:hypothetical protein